jgi:hypothetical protein
MRRALVIGAGGAAGRATLAALRRSGWDARGGGRSAGADVRVDLDRPETLLAAMRGVDVAFNTVPHPGLAAERTVLTHGGVLVNIADRDPAERRALRGIADPVGTVLLNWGVIPGTIGLLAAELLQREPSATRVELAVTFSALATSGAAGGDFLRRELTRRHRHATATIPFPRMLGPRRCLEFAEDQDGWLGQAAGGREVRAYVRLTEPGLNGALLAANRLGLLPGLPAALFTLGRGRSARRASAERFCVWAGVSRAGRRLVTGAVTGRGMYRSTGVAAVAAAEQLGGPLQPGCLDPSELLTLRAVEPSLAAGGVDVQR